MKRLLTLLLTTLLLSLSIIGCGEQEAMPKKIEKSIERIAEKSTQISDIVLSVNQESTLTELFSKEYNFSKDGVYKITWYHDTKKDCLFISHSVKTSSVTEASAVGLIGCSYLINTYSNYNSVDYDIYTRVTDTKLGFSFSSVVGYYGTDENGNSVFSQPSWVQENYPDEVSEDFSAELMTEIVDMITEITNYETVMLPLYI